MSDCQRLCQGRRSPLSLGPAIAGLTEGPHGGFGVPDALDARRDDERALPATGGGDGHTAHLVVCDIDQAEAVVTGAREPVDRALDVLVWLADHPGPSWSVRHVARELDTSPATIHRIFGLLERRNLLARDGSGRYSPGLELYRICQALAMQVSPTKLARADLEALAAQCGEAVLLAAYDAHRSEMMFLDMVQADHPLRYVIDLGRWIPLHAGATGLAILAYLPPSDRRRVYARGTPPVTSDTLTCPEAIETRLEAVRAAGYSITRGERTPGAVGIAAPIFDGAGDVYGDVCITIPTSRYDDSLEQNLVASLRQTCEAITRTFFESGFRRP